MRTNYFEVLDELNAWLEACGEKERQFGWGTDGLEDFINFECKVLWSTIKEASEFNEDENDYEPLVPFIKREFNKWVDGLNSLKFEI